MITGDVWDSVLEVVSEEEMFSDADLDGYAETRARQPRFVMVEFDWLEVADEGPPTLTAGAKLRRVHLE